MTATDQPFLPRFSDPRDVDEFVSVLEQFERGELSPEKFRTFRLTRGLYGQRQEGEQMIRVKVPTGSIAAAQLDALADVADRYGHGIAHVTTRQNVQFHFVKMAQAEDAMRLLADAGLTTREACSNTVRNVTCDPLSGLTKHSLFDVRPYAEAVVRHLIRADYDQALPRKFKIAFSSSPDDHAMAAINDLGFVARLRDGARGFKMVAAGGLSTNPMNAIVLHEFIPPGEILDAAEAVVKLFDRTGNRENKHRARLKYVVKKLGAEKFREMYAEERAKIVERGGTRLETIDVTPDAPPPPRVDTDEPGVARAPGYLAWRGSNVIDQIQPGYAAAKLRLPLGALTSAQLRALSQIATRFSDGVLRFTIDQNLVLKFVPVGRLSALHAALDAVGLARAGASTVSDVLSCPGAESCALAVTASRQLGTSISTRLDGLSGHAREALDLASTAEIKISGCPNSCGQHHVADLGFHGAVRKVGDRSAPVYQLHLGGGIDGETGATFGRQVVKIPARRVAEAVERLLVLYADERATDESPRAFYRRVASDRVQSLLLDLTTLDAATPDSEFVDIGQEQGFVVSIGAGECAA